MKPRQKQFIKRSSAGSITHLIDLAHDSQLKGKKERAARYIKMAWELLKKNKAKLPKEYRNGFCRKCLSVWIPDDTATAYFDRKCGCLRIKCRNCGHSRRL